jgi:hypothetical protein
MIVSSFNYTSGRRNLELTNPETRPLAIKRATFDLIQATGVLQRLFLFHFVLQALTGLQDETGFT